jgi:hypothetical protein
VKVNFGNLGAGGRGGEFKTVADFNKVKRIVAVAYSLCLIPVVVG